MTFYIFWSQVFLFMNRLCKKCELWLFSLFRTTTVRPSVFSRCVFNVIIISSSSLDFMWCWMESSWTLQLFPSFCSFSQLCKITDINNSLFISAFNQSIKVVAVWHSFPVHTLTGVMNLNERHVEMRSQAFVPQSSCSLGSTTSLAGTHQCCY